MAVGFSVIVMRVYLFVAAFIVHHVLQVERDLITVSAKKTNFGICMWAAFVSSMLAGEIYIRTALPGGQLNTKRKAL